MVSKSKDKDQESVKVNSLLFMISVMHNAGKGSIHILKSDLRLFFKESNQANLKRTRKVEIGQLWLPQ